MLITIVFTIHLLLKLDILDDIFTDVTVEQDVVYGNNISVYYLLSQGLLSSN